MKAPFQNPLAIVILSLLIGGCEDRSVKQMSYGEFIRLSDEDRLRATKKLSSNELRNLTAMVASNRYDSVSLERKALGDLIAEGEKIRERIESTPPTR